jgi:hypothetical protein
MYSALTADAKQHGRHDQGNGFHSALGDQRGNVLACLLYCVERHSSRPKNILSRISTFYRSLFEPCYDMPLKTLDMSAQGLQLPDTA